MMNLYKNLIFFILLIIFFCSKSQSTKQGFDLSLAQQTLAVSEQNVSSLQIIESNLKMLEKAKKENDKEGIIWSNIKLGIEYNNLSKPDLSIKYFNNAKKMADKISSNNETYSKLYLEIARVYYNLELYNETLKYSSKAMYYGEKIKNFSYKKEFLGEIYRIRSASFPLNDKDSPIYYLHKSAKIHNSPRIYSDLADHYINEDPNLDSAKIYLNKSEMMYGKIKNANKYDLSVLYYYYGNLFILEKKYNKAILYLEKSLTYVSKGSYSQHISNVYDSLAKAYSKLGNTIKEKEILETQKKMNKDYNEVQSKSIELSIKNIEAEHKKVIPVWLYVLLASAIIIMLSTFIVLKKQKKMLEQKAKDIEIKNKQYQEIEVKLDDKIDDLYESAKTRDPNFYTKFQNLYPDFIKDLLAINPNLQNSELQLLAYIYLKFETKQIADLLFLSPKTIQNRKYNIRKKLKIATSDDLYIWLKSFNLK